MLATSGVARREEVLDSVACGARGFVHKTAGSHIFLDAVATVAAGDYHLSSRLAGYFVCDRSHRPLRKRELDESADRILRSIAQGDSIAEVVAAGQLSAEEVQRRIGEIFDAARRRRRLLRPTAREEQVLALIGGQRLTHQQAARQLGIAPRTVSEHLGNIQRKYLESHREAPQNLAAGAAAQAWAIELGLCD